MKTMRNNYTDYVSEYNRWVESLPEDEKNYLKSLGLDKPDPDDRVVSSIGYEIQDWDIVTNPNFEEGDDDKPLSKSREEFLDGLRRLVVAVASSPNPILALGGLVFALELHHILGYPTMESWGDEFGFTRAAVSKQTQQFCEILGIPKCSVQKPQH